MNAKNCIAWPVASLLCLIGSLQTYAFSEFTADKCVIQNEPMALLYLSCGNANLISKNYSAAVEDYRKGLDALTSAGDNGIAFLISFGMTVACDNLQRTEQCQSSIEQIRNLLNIPEKGDDVSEYPFLENEEVPNYLKIIVGMAPSVEIRGTLFSFLSEIFPYSVVSYPLGMHHTKGSPCPCERHLIAQPCKSFWKRLEKLGHNIRRACEKVLDILERCLNISDKIQGTLKEKTENRESV